MRCSTGSCHATRRDQALEFPQFALRLHQRGGDTALLTLEQLLALDDDQGPVQVTDIRPEACGSDAFELAPQRPHGASLRRSQESRFRCAVPEGQGDQAVEASGFEAQLQLRAPESAVAHQGAGSRPSACVLTQQCVVDVAEPVEAGFQHRLVGAVAGIGAVQERHVTRLADGTPRPTTRRSLSALRVPAAGQISVRRRSNVRVEVRVSNASTSVESSKRATAARAIAI